ncbi:ketoacyl-ACP synthase III [Halobacteriovorax marinus]|uniref:Beta-ketoacyl-[acyl-carrier-protein] synthase III n=1 Tax=Halobacteriovorax marinus (strain ATCC BAA-682 / DSM 15412 / SJ) TaxID=862908 RepID=E1WZL1_HALMS|nr:beta-ketoacyl-ACP synthase III [Halobacteriovorax marinus]ATH07566.1 ketoacyl-ACP synthase III [Halobacteriovorax marinus]CBW26197.1 3-oxoacyl-[acyl-carrier-protein] synthase III [Halobacteriovorax marinus SJ]
MSYNSRITGVGSYVPPQIYKNSDIEEMMDTSNEWIIQRTGIEQRHWVDENTSTSDLALEASKIAIKDAGLEASDIDMIVFATLSPDHDFPGTGCFLQAKLGIEDVTAFDIRQQCTGFLYGLSMADKFVQSGSHKNVLVVGAEVHSKGLDKTPNGRAVSVLFGDGAGAVVVSRTEVKDKTKDPHIMTTNLHADGSYAKELWVAAPGSAVGPDRMSHALVDEGLHFPFMNGKTVFVHAVKRMAETLMLSCKEMGVGIEDVDLFLFHQANLRINSKVAEVLKIPEDKIFNTIQKYGNTTAATIPLGMHDAIKANKLKKGMLVASAAFGSGFTWASGLWRY